MVSNQGSCIRIKCVFVALFKRACVIALHLRIFTDAIKIGGGTPAIKARTGRQCCSGGTRGSTSVVRLGGLRPLTGVFRHPPPW